MKMTYDKFGSRYSGFTLRFMIYTLSSTNYSGIIGNDEVNPYSPQYRIPAKTIFEKFPVAQVLPE